MSTAVRFQVGDVVKVIRQDEDQVPAMITAGGGGIVETVTLHGNVFIGDHLYRAENLELIGRREHTEDTHNMNKETYIKYHAEMCTKMQAITKAKNSDYTGTTDDPFRNFSDSETYAGVSTERGFLVRMGDKMARVRSFVDKGTLEVKDEAVEDTLLDLANYCILLSGYLKGKR